MRALQSVGMAAFGAHLDLFAAATRDEDAVDALQGRTGWAHSGCRTRVKRARAILADGQRQAALALVAEAARVPDATRDAARRLMAG